MNLFNGFHSINKRIAVGASGASGVLGGNTTTAYCSISGLRAWYDANSPTTYSLSSNLLQTWGDKSGWGTHMTRWGNTGTTSNAAYSSTGLNGAAAFTFSGVSNAGAAGHNSLSAGTNCALNQFPNGISFVALFIKNGTQATNESIVITRNQGSNANPMEGYNTSRFYGGGTGGTVGSFTSSQNMRNLTTSPGYLQCITYSTTQAYEYMNSTQTASYTLSNPVVYKDDGSSTGLTYSYLNMGTRYDKFTAFNGNIAEVLVFNKSLSTGERQAVEGYLALKYNVQSILPSGHPHKNISDLAVSLSSYFSVYTPYASANSSNFSYGSGLPTFTSNSTTISGNSNTLLNGTYSFGNACGSSNAQATTVYNCFNNASTSTICFVSGSNYASSSTQYNAYSGTQSITLASGQTVSGDRITFSFPNPIKINSYQLTHTNQGSGWPDRYLAAWALVGSNDNSTWYMVDYYEYNPNTTITNPQPSRTVYCGADGYYQYYALIGVKLAKNAAGGGTVWSLCSFNITSATS